jgi:hypothetical protein
MGDDQPRPGIRVFQETFSVADQRSGSLGLAEIAREPGPRNCGQTASAADVAKGLNPASSVATIIKTVRFLFILLVSGGFLVNGCPVCWVTARQSGAADQVSEKKGRKRNCLTGRLSAIKIAVVGLPVVGQVSGVPAHTTRVQARERLWYCLATKG